MTMYSLTNYLSATWKTQESPNETRVAERSIQADESYFLGQGFHLTAELEHRTAPSSHHTQ